MNARSRTIPLDQAEAGNVLAVDVCDSAGHTLLAAGAQLSAASIASLRQRGIAAVCIEQPMSEAELAALRAAAAQRLDHLFRRTTDDPLMNRLHDAVLAFRLEQLR